MELMAEPTAQQSYCKDDSTVCVPLNLALKSLQKNIQKLNELCSFPEVDVTPVNNHKSKNNINATEINEQGSSLAGDSIKEYKENSEEKSDTENLLRRLPILNQFFQLHNKIGEGTFSTVYLASLKNSSPTKNYAVKHLKKNCQQLRIEGEFKCMTEIGGKDNVVHADYCLSSGDDCVTFVMPYLPHKKFSDYVLDMNADETRLYMKNLFIALRRVHSFNIIHRDVKPGNFLYNRETKQFLLVDFGLAQVVDNHNSGSTKLITPTDENMPIDYSKKRKRNESTSEKDMTTPIKRSKRMALKSKDNNIGFSRIFDDFGNIDSLNNETSIMNSGKLDFKGSGRQYPNKASQNKTPLKCRVMNSINPASVKKKNLFDETLDNKAESLNTGKEKQISLFKMYSEGKTSNTSAEGFPREKSFTALMSNKSSSGSFVQFRDSRVLRECATKKSKTSEVFQKPAFRRNGSEQCSCSGRGAICAMCSSRSKMFAPRAGTPGFRPPEVLLKYVNQTTAVDMWASGVILLCILSGCYPFFKSPNDLVALAEIMTVFGTEPITKIATKFGRRVVCSEMRKGVDLKKLCKILRTRNTKRSNAEKESLSDIKCNDCSQTIKKDGCLCILENEKDSNVTEDSLDIGFPDSAFDLLNRLLDIDPTTRITATEALEHPFILGL